MRRRGRDAGLWPLASDPAAAAHGVLESSEPAGGSSLERAPAAATLRFRERLDPGLSMVRVLDRGGRVVAGGPAPPVAAATGLLVLGGRRAGEVPQPGPV
jgi:methionine-rich copper-binding protein CopC